MNVNKWTVIVNAVLTALCTIFSTLTASACVTTFLGFFFISNCHCKGVTQIFEQSPFFI